MLPAVLLDNLRKVGKKVEDLVAVRRTLDPSSETGDAPIGNSDAIPIAVTEEGDLKVGGGTSPGKRGWTAWTRRTPPPPPLVQEVSQAFVFRKRGDEYHIRVGKRTGENG